MFADFYQKGIKRFVKVKVSKVEFNKNIYYAQNVKITLIICNTYSQTIFSYSIIHHRLNFIIMNVGPIFLNFTVLQFISIHQKYFF